jgi:hypothetical protein
MAVLTGEAVTVQRSAQVGVNSRNEPVFEWEDETVDDVLVTPGPRDDIDDSTRPTGVRVEWSLIWPKTYTKPLAGCRVIVRGGAPLNIIGDPHAFANAPTRWNRPSEAGRTDG